METICLDRLACALLGRDTGGCRYAAGYRPLAGGAWPSEHLNAFFDTLQRSARSDPMMPTLNPKGPKPYCNPMAPLNPINPSLL